MPDTRELAARFEAYADWRRRLSLAIGALHQWLVEQELADSQLELRIDRLRDRLNDDRLVVAFVAEFSRGKSELINAIFFADFGQRLLPSAAGRTTMCPTELLHDEGRAPSIRLLPIETRGREATVAEFKNYPDEWHEIALDLASPERMAQALARVADVKRVAPAVARSFGFSEEADGPATGDDGETVEIPAWRHAVINFPHPLLKKGLVILDTPGLNAVGTEPELTLSLLPNAHAVMFVLAADAGVTKSDLDVWTKHIASDEPGQRSGRLIVLNKIDGLWDQLRSQHEIDAEIARQLELTASVLRVPEAQVHGVSAQKGLLARINGDDALLAKSRLPDLEHALSSHLLPAKREIVGAAVLAEARSLHDAVRSLLEARKGGIAEQLAELRALRGKNQDVVEHMMERVRADKETFERGLSRFTALRNVMTEQTNRLFEHIGLEALRANATETRRAIEASPFTKGVRTAMSAFFKVIRDDLGRAAKQSAEIHELMVAMYARFSQEYGLAPFTPPPFSILKYEKEIDRLERAYATHFNTLWNMVSRAKFALMKRFFDTIASRVKHVYQVANRDLDAWSKAVMAPLETHVREHHLQLRRRLDSIKRIHRASDELETRLSELEAGDAALDEQLADLARALQRIESVADEPEALPLAANA